MAEGTKVAVPGTGIMGSAMARNLLSAGMEMRLWNRSREKAEPLVQDGARIADNPADAARGADFLLTMLSDADAIEDVLGDRVLDGLAEDDMWLQTSTVGESGNARLAGLAAGHGEEDTAADPT